MSTAVYVIAALAAAAVLFPLVRLLIRAYAEFRGVRVVTCPETHEPVAVRLAAGHAAVTRLTGEPDLKLTECTRWPERRNCGQECLSQIEAAPVDCLVRVMLARWYAGKTCVFCGKPLGDTDWMQHKPAAMNPEGRTIEWRDVAPERIPAALATHKPVCWNCHVAETFRREHPDLVTDRPWR